MAGARDSAFRGLTLLRGFDARPVHVVLDGLSTPALCDRLRPLLPGGAPDASISRYRTGVLQLPVFVPSQDWAGGQQAFDRDLLVLVATTMERTQV